MTGLFFKDWQVIKSTLKSNLFILAFLIVYCIIRKHAIIILTIPAILLSTCVSSTIKSDWGIKWDKLAVIMPIKRSEIVLSKYIELFLLCFTGVLISIFFGGVMQFTMNIDVIAQGFLCLLGASIGIVSGAILMPLLHKFCGNNGENSEIATVIAYSIGVGIVFLSFYVLKRFLFGMDLCYLSLAVLIISLFVFLIGYKVTVILFCQKEFY